MVDCSQPLYLIYARERKSERIEHKTRRGGGGVTQSSLPFCAGVQLSRDSLHYGKPNGAKFKKQNWLHAQQICYQGQGRFQSSSTKSIHVQPIFSQGQDI